jgi:hypothetical protein
MVHLEEERNLKKFPQRIYQGSRMKHGEDTEKEKEKDEC